MATREASAPSIADALGPWPPGAAFRALTRWVERRVEAERDQLPLWLPVGLILGISAWFWLPDLSAWVAWLAAALGVALAAFAFAGESRAGRAIGIFALAAALGCAIIWWKAERVAAPRLERAGLLEFSGQVESVQPLAAKGILRLVVARQGDGLRLRVNLPEAKAPARLRPGATVRARGWMMPPPAMAAPGGYDFSRTAWFQRIGGTGRPFELEVVRPAETEGWKDRLAAWRSRLAAHIRNSVAGDGEGGIAAALATGDQHGINADDAEAMRRSGLAHLLSVSGLHLTAVVGAAMLIALKLLALSPTLALRLPLVTVAAAIGAVAGLAYTLLTGAEVPTVRACIASLLVLIGVALGRDALTLRLVAAGALVVLLWWPETLAGPSFQMSFAAIVAIVALNESPHIRRLVSRRDEGPLAAGGRILLALVLTGLAVELALTPIALFHFHKAGLYGAAANVIAIPLTTFVIMPMEALALLFDLVGAGAPFWWVTGQCLSFLLWLAHQAAAAPGAVTLMPAIPRGAFALMVAGGLWICLWRSQWRLFGLAPLAAGAIWALTIPAPDLIVTGDGRHLVLRLPSGDLALLRPKAGDYIRSTLSELAGAEPDFVDLQSLKGAACSPDLCAVRIAGKGRSWNLLVTRTPQFVRWDQMVAACARADIVVADRMLPRACQPRWLKADRLLLRRTGGLAISLGETPRVRSVAGEVGRHPWAAPAPRGSGPAGHPQSNNSSRKDLRRFGL